MPATVAVVADGADVPAGAGGVIAVEPADGALEPAEPAGGGDDPEQPASPATQDDRMQPSSTDPRILDDMVIPDMTKATIYTSYRGRLPVPVVVVHPMTCGGWRRARIRGIIGGRAAASTAHRAATAIFP
ncbi:MAG TPA: hypothetical protein VFP92_00140 [Rhodanobacteraceae bacterium]|nr:hypothetical protein [Rhodanobacteraceae bacterium]